MSSVSSISFPAMIQMPSLQAGTAQGADFQGALRAAVGQVEDAQAASNTAIQNFVSGQGQELHSTILATQNAELQFDLLLQVRNKVVSAYEEIMKMQV